MPCALLRHALGGEYAKRSILITDFPCLPVFRRAKCRLSIFHAVVPANSDTSAPGAGLSFNLRCRPGSNQLAARDALKRGLSFRRLRFDVRVRIALLNLDFPRWCRRVAFP